jgi:hypothetical protein
MSAIVRTKSSWLWPVYLIEFDSLTNLVMNI